MSEEGMIRKGVLFALPLALAACGQQEGADGEQTADSAPLEASLTDAKIVVDANGVGAKGDPMRFGTCLLYTSPSPRDATLSRMPSSA